jgi:DNA-binding transcriptional LysR family regulator
MAFSQPDWDDLRYFLAVARAGTLSRAARSLKVSQPTVGRRLKALERRLDIRLFERLPNELILTSAGHRLLPVAERMERESFELSRVVEAQSGQKDAPVRVTAIGSVALFLTRHFDRIAAQCGGHDIEIISTGERLSLARNEADIALRMGRIPRKGNLVVRKIGRIAYALYASEDFVQRNGLHGEHDIRRARFVGHRKNPKRPSQSQWLYDFGQGGEFPLRVNELHLRYDAATRGLGIALLPCHLGDGCQVLVRVVPPPAELTEDIYLLVHAGVRGVARIERVSEVLAALFAERQDQLLGQA